MTQRTAEQLLAERAAKTLGDPLPRRGVDVIRADAPLPDDGTNGTNGRRLALVRACDVTPEPVRWLWDGRVPFGKLTGIEGRMGVGKTTTLMALTAAVTRGRGLPGMAACDPAAVIVISVEDSASDTLVPRLLAAGADLARVHLFDGYRVGDDHVPGIFDIGSDVQRLRETIIEHGAGLVALDPFSAMLGTTVNAYKDQDVRRVLAPLAQVADDTGAAIVFARHLRKGGGAAEDAGGGSVGIGAACRSVLRVDADPEADSSRFLLSSVKTTNGPRPPTLAYSIESVSLAGGIETSRTRWEGESRWTAQELAERAMAQDDRPRSDEARDWLLDALEAGPRSARELFKAAEADGIPRRTLQRAADVLGIERERKGFGEGSQWSLPNRANDGTNGTNEAPPRHSRQKSPFASSFDNGVNGMNGANGSLGPDGRTTL